MSFEIDDSKLPCVAAGIGGVFVPENLNIIEVCQDADNLGIIYVEALVQGVFEYTPVMEASWEDQKQIIDHVFVPKYKGEGQPTLKVNTGCTSKTVILAYNVGSVISNYSTVKEITFNLKMVGSSEPLGDNPIIDETFQSSNPSDSVTFVKGLNPKPYQIQFDAVTNKLIVKYSSLGDKPCLCAINCAAPTEEDFNLTICEDEIQKIKISTNPLFGEPIQSKLTFIDPVGNSSEIDIHSMLYVIPAKPQAFSMNNPKHVKVGFSYVTARGNPVKKDKVSYQVVRYEHGQQNARVWKDWSSSGSTNFIDSDVKSGSKYGYAVRFRGEFGEVSKLSQWTQVTIP